MRVFEKKRSHPSTHKLTNLNIARQLNKTWYDSVKGYMKSTALSGQGAQFRNKLRRKMKMAIG